VGRGGGEGEKESADGPENDIRTATATTRSVTGLVFFSTERVYG
jgi:hypothetical protein